MTIRLVVLTAVFLSLSEPAFATCSDVEFKEQKVMQGDRCAVGYLTPPSGYVVSSGVGKVGEFVRQFVTSGMCKGEQIVFYYSCDTGRGLWLGGSYDADGGYRPDSNPLPGLTGRSGITGPALYFVEGTESDWLYSGKRMGVDDLYALARSYPWVAQSGLIAQPRVTVEGKTFDLSCGCRLKPVVMDAEQQVSR